MAYAIDARIEVKNKVKPARNRAKKICMMSGSIAIPNDDAHAPLLEAHISEVADMAPIPGSTRRKGHVVVEPLLHQNSSKSDSEAT